jgi:hypothetical protein
MPASLATLELTPSTLASDWPAPIVHAVGDCIDADDAELVRLVNQYRVANGLPAVTSSRWLNATAQWHLWDRQNNPAAVGGICNTHSWSNSPPAGVTWTGMCYTADHAQAAQMWAKPSQISVGVYVGNGFELAADAPGQTPANALAQWQASPSHNPVILNQGPWSGIQFRAIGASISGPFAVLWFGDGQDPDVAMLPCQADNIHANGFESA